jgi:hypothetical protein
VSNGRWGGVRAIEALIHPLRKMGLVITSVDMQFPSVQELFDTEGKLKDQKYAEYTQKSIKELIWMAKALKAARALESH